MREKAAHRKQLERASHRVSASERSEEIARESSECESKGGGGSLASRPSLPWNRRQGRGRGGERKGERTDPLSWHGRRKTSGGDIALRRVAPAGATDDGEPEVCRSFSRRGPGRTSPAAELRLIRDGAAGSLRVPGPAITSDQTIHKAGARWRGRGTVRGRRWKGEQKDIFGG